MRVKEQAWVLGLTLTAAGWALAGCGEYRLVRWPRRSLWARQVMPAVVIEPPAIFSSESSETAGSAEREGVRAALSLIDAQGSFALFQTNFQRQRIQPTVLAIENGSGVPYLFNKANLAKDYVPASEAGRWACPHPVLTAARHARWALFFVPGLLMQAVVEPASTLDFPKFEELASRPASVDCQAIREAYARAEISDGPLAPSEVRQGILFLRPVALGGTIPLALINPQTQEMLVLELPTPAPVHVDTRLYAAAPEAAWAAVAEAVKRTTSWSLVSSDQAAGRLTARTGFRVPGWDTRRRFTVQITPADAMQTDVAVESTLRGSDSTSLGRSSRTVDDFFAVLDELLAVPAPSVMPGTPEPDAAEGTVARTAGL